MSQQQVVALEPSQVHSQEEDTSAVLYEYVFGRAREDTALNQGELRSFESAHQNVITRGSQAALVGRRLAELGDEIDAQYQEEMREIVQLAGSPETAFSMFHDVVKNLFEWDEQGGARINIGRIAALLAYCYHLCKTYITQNVATGSLLSFLAMVAGWLFKFLLKAKFYQWLDKQGGWGQLLSIVTRGWGNSVFLVIGVASLAIWAYNYFKR